MAMFEKADDVDREFIRALEALFARDGLHVHVNLSRGLRILPRGWSMNSDMDGESWDISLDVYIVDDTITGTARDIHLTDELRTRPPRGFLE